MVASLLLPAGAFGDPVGWSRGDDMVLGTTFRGMTPTH
jgi:hypothetical protein